MSVSYTRPIASIRDGKGVVVGAGWLALGRYVVTCAHVVADALGLDRETTKIPAGLVRLDLPFLGKTGLTGRVVAWYPVRPLADLVRDQLADVAVLELEGDETIDGGLEAGKVDRRIPPRGTPFLTYGFPKGFDNGVGASGEVLDKDAGGWLQVRDTQAYGYFIQPGFSGAPAMNPSEMRLIGMATAADRDQTTRLAFLMPSHLICRAFPPLAQPYRGLSAFREEDTDLFFGRGGFVKDLEAKLQRHAFAAVIGPSGSGKSSVVLAGLAPRLREKGWNVVACRPSRDPLLQLSLSIVELTSPGTADFETRNKKAEEWKERLLRDPGRIVDLAQGVGGAAPERPTPTLLVIDQFEELFTNDADSPDGGIMRKAEITLEGGSPRQVQLLAVLEAIARQTNPKHALVRVVVAMRADFMDQALAIRRLAGLLQNADVKLGPMTAAELNEAIRQPARAFDVEFEEGLTEELVAKMQGRPGGLPLLQFALDRLWRRQHNRKLTWTAYRGPDGKGELETTLDEHANEVIGDLGAAALPGVRRLMLRLVRLGEVGGAPDARVVARRSEIGETDWPLAQKLADEHSRLLTLDHDPATGEETAEVVHEALIGVWGQLRNWLVEDRSFGLWRQRLKEGVGAWSATPDRDLLLRGRRLAEAMGWRESRNQDLNPKEHAFIEASDQEARLEAAAELQQALERERLATELAQVAQQREETANKLAETAQEQERIATELAETRGQALADAEASRLRQKRSGNWLRVFVAMLVFALAIGGHFYWQNLIERERAERAQTDAEEQREIAEAEAAKAKLNETVAITTLARSAFAQGNRLDAARLLLTAWPRVGDESRPALKITRDSAGEILDQPRQTKAYLHFRNKIKSVSYSQDGSRILVGAEWWEPHSETRYFAYVLDAATRKTALFIKTKEASPGTEFSPNGQIIILGSGSSALYYSAESGSQIDLSGPAEFTANGSKIAILENKNRMLILSASNFSRISEINFEAPVADDFAISADGSAVLTIDENRKTARLSSTSEGRILETFKLSQFSSKSVRLSPDGKKALAVDYDGGALIYDFPSKQTIPISLPSPIETAEFSSDSQTVLLGSKDSVRQFRLQSHSTERIYGRTDTDLSDISDKNLISNVSYQQGGKLVVFESNGITHIYDSHTNSMVDRLATHGRTLVISPDGKTIITANTDSSNLDGMPDDYVLLFYDLPELKEIKLQGESNDIASAKFSVDGSRFVVMLAGQPRFLVYDPTTGRKLNEFGVKTGVGALSLFGNRAVAADWAEADEEYPVPPPHPSDLKDKGTLNARKSLKSPVESFIRVFDTATGKEVAVLAAPAGLTSVHVSPNGSRVAAIVGKNRAIVFDTTLRQGRELFQLGPGVQEEAATDQIVAVDFSLDGSRLMFRRDNCQIHVFENATGKALSNPYLPCRFLKEWGAVEGADFAVFSPDGDRILGIGTGELRVFGADTGTAILEVNPRGVNGFGRAAYSNDGDQIIVPEGDGLVILDAASGERKLDVIGEAGPAYLSKGGSRIIVKSTLGIRVLDALTGALLSSPLLDAEIMDVSPDETRLATKSKKGLQVWDISAIGKDDVFQIVCQQMNEEVYPFGEMTSFSDFAEKYDLKDLVPICGDHIPLAVNQANLR